MTLEDATRRAFDDSSPFAMTAMMTTRLVVRNSVGCIGRRATFSAFSARGAPSRPSTSRRIAIPGSRVDVAVRAVATDADTKTTTKPFRRHERIASIKVRSDPSDRACGSTPPSSDASPERILSTRALFTSGTRGKARRVRFSERRFHFLTPPSQRSPAHALTRALFHASNVHVERAGLGRGRVASWRQSAAPRLGAHRPRTEGFVLRRGE